MRKIYFILLVILLFLSFLFVGCQEKNVKEPPPVESTVMTTTPVPSQPITATPTIAPEDEPITVPLITADMLNLTGIDKALFDGAVAFLGRQTDNAAKMTIPYIGIFGQYEMDGKTNVVCHVGLKHFMYDPEKTAMIFDGTIITYGLAILTVNEDGDYICDSFVLAGDGAAEAKDVTAFCGPLTELPSQIYDGLKYRHKGTVL